MPMKNHDNSGKKNIVMLVVDILKVVGWRWKIIIIIIIIV